MVRLVYDSTTKSTNNLEPLQHSDANYIIVHPCKLLIIVHDYNTLRKALINIIDTIQFFKFPLWVVRLFYSSRYKSTSNLECLQYTDANGIIVHPWKLLIIVNDWFSKIPFWVVRLVYDFKKQFASNFEPLQNSDANGIIVHPCKLLIIVHDCYTLRKALIAIIAWVQFFKIPLWVVRLVYESINKSTSNLEPLLHSDANGIIVHPCKLLIIVHDCYNSERL